MRAKNELHWVLNELNRVSQKLVSVEVLTDALFAVRAGLEALVALTLVGALGVDAVAVFAQIAVGRTLVDVAAVVRHADLCILFHVQEHPVLESNLKPRTLGNEGLKATQKEGASSLFNNSGL